MLLFNISKFHIIINNSSNNDASFSICYNRKCKESSKTFRIARNKKNIDRHVIFYNFKI